MAEKLVRAGLPPVSTPSRQDSETLYDETEGRAEPPAPATSVDGGYGWVCVACSALIAGHTWGVNSSYGVFLSFYLSNNYFPGATPLQFAFVGGLSISMAMLVSPIVTISSREFGTRTTLLIGVFFETLALITASFATKIWQLFLSQGVSFGIGMGFLFVGSVGIVPQWFTRRRSLANGISVAGAGLGGLVYSLATNRMIQTIGLPWAFRILGIVAFSVNTVSSFLIKDRNKAIGSKQLAFDYRLFTRLEFVLMECWTFFSVLGYVVLLFSLPNYALSVGLTPSQGALIGALLNLGQAIGRPVIGLLSDKCGRINMATIATGLAGVFCLAIWIPAKSYGVLVFFAIICGTGAGTIFTTIAPVGAEVVGLKELPSALSLTWLVFVLPALFSEPIGLETRQDDKGNYYGVQIFTGIMYLTAATFLWFLRAWKIGQVQALAAQEGRRLDDTDTILSAEKQEKTTEEGRLQVYNVSERLLMWKKV